MACAAAKMPKHKKEVKSDKMKKKRSMKHSKEDLMKAHKHMKEHGG